MNTEPGQDMHVFTWIVIFMLSDKEPNESTVVKHNIDQNNFCNEGPQISTLTWAPPRPAHLHSLLVLLLIHDLTYLLSVK